MSFTTETQKTQRNVQKVLNTGLERSLFDIMETDRLADSAGLSPV